MGDAIRELYTTEDRKKIDTLSLTLAIGQILQERGIDVLYTRTTDIYESPYQKAMEANEAGVDFFISIHRNSFPQDKRCLGSRISCLRQIRH